MQLGFAEESEAETAAIPIYCECEEQKARDPDGEPTQFYLFGISKKKTLLICCTKCGGTQEVG